MSADQLTVVEGDIFPPVFCDGDGSPPPQVSWFRDGINISQENTLDFTESVTRYIKISFTAKWIKVSKDQKFRKYIIDVYLFYEAVYLLPVTVLPISGVTLESTTVTFLTFMEVNSLQSIWWCNTNLNVGRVFIKLLLLFD